MIHNKVKLPINYIKLLRKTNFIKQKFTGNGITAGTLQDRDVGRNSGHKFSRFINIKKGSIFKNKAIKDIST